MQDIFTLPLFRHVLETNQFHVYFIWVALDPQKLIIKYCLTVKFIIKMILLSGQFMSVVTRKAQQHDYCLERKKYIYRTNNNPIYKAE